jgi:AcrR family transcriptional regulator
MMTGISADTKQQILDVAERLFADKGFAGTSLRSVVREANVNLAAVHYHFGSKEGLYRAVVARIAEQIVTAQLGQLSKCVSASDPPQLEAILAAFLAPPLEILVNAGEQSIHRARFIGRCRTEPDPVQAIVHKEFHPSEQAFLDILQRSLPDQSRTELAWKLDLVVASLIRVATEAGKSNALLQSNTPDDIQKTVSRLVHFLAAGFHTND